VAAQSLAEADKIKRVTQAEAEAESKRLQGEGVAAQRKAIALGIAEQYEMLRKVGIENSAEQLLLMTQYFDTMQDVARNGRSNVLYLPSNPGSVGAMGDEIRTAMLQAQAANEANQDGEREQARVSAAQLREEEQERAERARTEAQHRAREAREQAQRAAADTPPCAPPAATGQLRASPPRPALDEPLTHLSRPAPHHPRLRRPDARGRDGGRRQRAHRHPEPRRPRTRRLPLHSRLLGHAHLRARPGGDVHREVARSARPLRVPRGDLLHRRLPRDDAVHAAGERLPDVRGGQDARLPR